MSLEKPELWPPNATRMPSIGFPGIPVLDLAEKLAERARRRRCLEVLHGSRVVAVDETCEPAHPAVREHLPR
jgi:hypothetical protein